MHHQTQGNLDFLLFSSRNFMVLCFIFRSIIHFELMLFEECKICIYIHLFLHVDTQLFQHNLMKRLSFTLLNYLCSLVKNQFTIFVWVYFWSLYFAQLINVSFFSPSSTKLLDYSKSWSWVVSVLQLSYSPSSVLC